ncbi:MAG: hypothetical protein ACK6BZ_09680, partial [Candidatus Kapaibacterium sp.]
NTFSLFCLDESEQLFTTKTAPIESISPNICFILKLLFPNITINGKNTQYIFRLRTFSDNS